MAVKNSKNVSKTELPIVQTVEGNRRMVSLNQTFSPLIFDSVTQYMKDMGLTSEQDVVRLAVATFLKREGYIIN